MDIVSNDIIQTEIGILPSDWKLKKIVNACDLIMGQSPPGETYNQNGEGMPFLQGKAEFTIIFPEHIKFTTKPIKIAAKGSVLMSVRAPVGDVNLAQIDYCIGRGLASLSLTDGDNLFLFYVLQFYKNEIEEYGSGSTFKAINKSNLENFIIPIPPKHEQKSIANILSTVQEAREKTEAVIKATQELKKSMMKHLFTYGAVPVDEVDRVKLKDTDIGLMPEDWEVVKIGDVTKVQGGYAFKSADYIDEGLQVFRISNVSFGKTLWEDVVYVPKDYADKHSDYLLNSGDLVMAMTRPIVTGGIKVTRLTKSDVPCLLNQRVCRLIPKKINLEYLFQILFDKPFIESISNGALGSQQPNISASKIEGIPIPYPPLNIQEKISNILIIIDNKIKSELNRKQALDYLFKTLLHNLMTGKIRVDNVPFGSAQ